MGQALALYAGDADDRTPSSRPPGFLGGRATFGIGWAGRAFPYAKSREAFRCGTDAARASGPGVLPGMSVVSYGLNANLARAASSSAEGPARTVLLFEVVGGAGLVTDPEEGGPGGYRLVSPTADGTHADITSANAVWPGFGAGRWTRYATGAMDNAGGGESGDDIQGEAPRHGGGSNFAALDGHARWLRPLRVSAGNDALSSDSAQSASRCRTFRFNAPVLPCAEGTGLGSHTLTFSRE